MVDVRYEQTTPPTYKTKNWPAYNEALKRRGSLMIWFGPEMRWDAAPTGTQGVEQVILVTHKNPKTSQTFELQ